MSEWLAHNLLIGVPAVAVLLILLYAADRVDRARRRNHLKGTIHGPTRSG